MTGLLQRQILMKCWVHSHMAWKSASDNSIYYASHDGRRWGQSTKLHLKSDKAPVLLSSGSTLTMVYRRPDGSVQLSIGGGVVFDSEAQDEYAEALLKSRFAAA